MVETNSNQEVNNPQNTMQFQSLDSNNQINSAPVAWIRRFDGVGNNNGSNASNEKCPLKVDTSHPLWQTFLDSGTVSPLAFFRIFLSPPTYFNSPTPWRRSTRFAQKVHELLESFRPGTYIYQPFQKEAIRPTHNVESGESVNCIAASSTEKEHGAPAHTNDLEKQNNGDKSNESVEQEGEILHSLSTTSIHSIENELIIPELEPENNANDGHTTVEKQYTFNATEKDVLNESEGPNEVPDSENLMSDNIPNSSINRVLSERITRHKISKKLREARLSNFRKRKIDTDHESNVPKSELQPSSKVSARTSSSSNENKYITTYSLLHTSESTNRLDLELDENRQRLYVDTGRPRPFRRLYEDNVDDNNENNFNENVIEENRTIQSYQESHLTFRNSTNYQARDLQVTLYKGFLSHP